MWVEHESKRGKVLNSPLTWTHAPVLESFSYFGMVNDLLSYEWSSLSFSTN